MWGWVSNWWNYFPPIVGIIFEVIALVWLWPYLTRFKTAPSATLQQCPRCSYDLRATPDHCPECGLVVPEELRVSKSLH
jgi:hypothetical protein